MGKLTASLNRFVDDLCTNFMENGDLGASELEFVSDPVGSHSEDEGSYYAEEALQDKLDKAHTKEDIKKAYVALDAYKAKVAKEQEAKKQKSLKLKTQLSAELFNNGWTKAKETRLTALETKMETVKKKRSAMFNDRTKSWHESRAKHENYDATINNLKQEIGELDNEKTMYLRRVWIDRNPQLIKDICTNKDHADICKNIDKYLPKIKKELNNCFSENEDEIADAADFERNRDRMWAPWGGYH